MRQLIITAMCALVLVAGDISAAERFGRIYDVSGDVTMLRSGKRESLTRGKNLLAPVFEGDELTVKTGGRLLIVSARDNKGYELLAGASAKISGNHLQKTAGVVNMVKGLQAAPSDKELKVAPGALIMRGSRQCIKIISPQNENLIETAAILSWSNKCQRPEKVRIEVREDTVEALLAQPVFAIVTDSELVKMPPGILKHGTDYQWLVDGGQVMGKSSAYFRVLDAVTSAELASRRNDLNKYGNDVSMQLSYIFFLQENGLNSLAETEIANLKGKQEWNQFMIEVLEK